ncbi:MAG: hypothetical protein WKF83_09885 [Nocardioidaceae bacterium]
MTLERVLDGFSASSAADWPALVKEVASSDADRVVISSETFANADPRSRRDGDRGVRTGRHTSSSR